MAWLRSETRGTRKKNSAPAARSFVRATRTSDALELLLPHLFRAGWWTRAAIIVVVGWWVVTVNGLSAAAFVSAATILRVREVQKNTS